MYQGDEARCVTRVET